MQFCSVIPLRSCTDCS